MKLTSKQKNIVSNFFPELGSYVDSRQGYDNSVADSLIVALINKIESVQGEKGDKGDKGDLHITPEDLQKIAKIASELAKPVKGKDYNDPKDGKEGKPGRDGNNYVLTEWDKKEIAQKIKVPIVEKIIEIQKINTIKEIPFFDKTSVKGIVQDIISPYEKRLGSIEKSNTLNPKGAIDQRWGGRGGLQKVSHDTSLSGDGTPSNPLSVVGGSTFYNDTVSGLINSSNRVYTVPNTIGSPIVLFLSNSSYQSGVDYTVTGPKQITMTIAPDSSLSGQPFWLAHN